MTRLTKWLIAIAAISLTANLFAAGYIVGQARWGGHRDHSYAAREMGDPVMSSLRALSKRMTPDMREKFRENLRQLWRKNKADLRRMRDLNKEILEHLKRDEVDAGWLRRSYAEMRALADKTRQPFQDLFANTIAGMNVEERRAFIQDMEKMIREGHRHSHRGKPAKREERGEESSPPPPPPPPPADGQDG